MKDIANFFKHADKDPDGILDFNPVACEYLIIYSIFGILTYDIKPNSFESAFMMYLLIHKRYFLSDEGQKFVAANFPVEILEVIKSVSKKDYFEMYQAQFSEVSVSDSLQNSSPN